MVIRIMLRVSILILLVAGVARADLDDLGRTAGAPRQYHVGSAGDLCGRCPDPGGADVFGLDYRGGDLWAVATNGILMRLSGCDLVEIVPIQGFPSVSGLGYDSRRDLFILTDASNERIYQVDLHGNVVHTWPSPRTGAVGAAYDPNRDLYWISDWESDMMTSIDPNTGLPGPEFHVPIGGRIADAGYDAERDLLIYNARDQNKVFVVSVGDHQLQFGFSLPVPDPNLNSGEGLGIAPDGSLRVQHYSNSEILCVESDRPTPAASWSWGRLKARYRP